MSTGSKTFKVDWQQWHAARERDLATPHGWLSLTSFHWLTETPTALDGLPGRFSAADDVAILKAGRDDGYAALGGGTASAERTALTAAVDGTIRAQVAEDCSVEWVALGDVVVELALRGGRYAIRTRDSKAPALADFVGVPTFEVDPSWVLDATFEPFDPPRRIEVRTARADLSQDLTAVGAVTIRIDGREYALLATAAGGGALNIAFRDATNGDSTAPWRAVEIPAPDSDGRVRVDFNRAVNFPSAFSDYGTCPAPPAGNTLPVPILAGELAPVRRTR